MAVLPTPQQQTSELVSISALGTSGAITPKNIPLTDWQAAAATYVALLWMAEVPTLAPFAVAIAWGAAIIYAITVDKKGLPVLLAEAVTQGPSAATPTSTNQTAIVPAGSHPPRLGQQ